MIIKQSWQLKGLSTQLGHILQDVVSLLNGFQWSKVQYGKRSANTVAHALAKYAKDVSNEVVWIEDSLPLAVEALYYDSISIQWILRIVSFKIQKKKKKSYNVLGGIQQVLKVGKKNLLSISFFIIIKYDH